MCNMPKFQKTEARTGAGGGYNERDDVEYKESHGDDSGGEYDEVRIDSLSLINQTEEYFSSDERRKNIEVKHQMNKNRHHWQR